MPVKYAIADALKTNAGFIALAGDHVYPIRAEAQVSVPYVDVIVTGEDSEADLSGDRLTTYRARLDIYAGLDFDVEALKAAIISALDNKTGTLGSLPILGCFLTNSYDLEDSGVAMIEDYAGSLEFEIII